MDNIESWLSNTKYKGFDITIASQDASFRKYYRLTDDNKTFLLMDSSLEKESIKPFLNVTSKLLAVGAKAPKILEQDLENGFLIIEDFGSTHYLDVLNYDNFEELYKKAIDEIIKMQEVDCLDLPLYDKDFLVYEMNLMQEWYFEQLLPATLRNSQKEIIKDTVDIIADIVLTQPQDIFVHRDYHSRNIMITPNGSEDSAHHKDIMNGVLTSNSLSVDSKIGIIDYQDAMSGSITYDLASLLEDSYIEFEREDILKLILYFKDKKNIDIDDGTFIKWFDFTSMQRHIKVLGVFSRLYKRDGKKGYLQDIPLTLKYLFNTSKLYKETQPLNKLLRNL